MELSKKLVNLRKQKRLSQEELGNRLNVARQTISKWELGETTPDMDKLIELSKIFEISIDDLVGNENYKKTDKNTYYGKIRGYFEYQSKTKIKGIPLVHINIGYGFRKAKGIIAIGNMAQGLLAIGGIALGILSFGGFGVGIFTLAGIALGMICALGGFAIGTIAIGGIAIGIYAIGGVAIAKKIALGGYASGYIAIGDKVNGTIKFITENGKHTHTSTEIRNAILKEFPNTWNVIVSMFTIL